MYCTAALAAEHVIATITKKYGCKLNNGYMDEVVISAMGVSAVIIS